MTAPSRPLALLARSAVVMSDSLDGTAHVLPSRATPCAAWDLGTLIGHVSESVDLLTSLVGGSPPPSNSPDCRVRARQGTRQLLVAITHARPGRAGVELAALTGAFELTVHAWDINEATRCGQPLPADLASTLLALAPAVLGEVDRDGLFNPSHPPTPSQSTDLDRLLALFGRRRTEPALRTTGLRNAVTEPPRSTRADEPGGRRFAPLPAPEFVWANAICGLIRCIDREV